jgi:hypothetical protein
MTAGRLCAPDGNYAGIQVSFTEALQQPGEKRFGEE